MKDNLIYSEEFTKEALIEHTTRQLDQFHRLIKSQPLGDNTYNRKTIAALEISLAALTAEPVKYAANGSLFSQIGAAEVTARSYGVPVEPLYRSPIEGLK